VGFAPDDSYSIGSASAAAAADGHCNRPAVLLASHGLGVLCLERTCVMSGPEWSFVRVLEQAVANAPAGGQQGDEDAAEAHHILFHTSGENQVCVGGCGCGGDVFWARVCGWRGG